MNEPHRTSSIIEEGEYVVLECKDKAYTMQTDDTVQFNRLEYNVNENMDIEVLRIHGPFPHHEKAEAFIHENFEGNYI